MFLLEELPDIPLRNILKYLNSYEIRILKLLSVKLYNKIKANYSFNYYQKEYNRFLNSDEEEENDYNFDRFFPLKENDNFLLINEKNYIDYENKNIKKKIIRIDFYVKLGKIECDYLIINTSNLEINEIAKIKVFEISQMDVYPVVKIKKNLNVQYLYIYTPPININFYNKFDFNDMIRVKSVGRLYDKFFLKNKCFQYYDEKTLITTYYKGKKYEEKDNYLIAKKNYKTSLFKMYINMFLSNLISKIQKKNFINLYKNKKILYDEIKQNYKFEIYLNFLNNNKEIKFYFLITNKKNITFFINDNIIYFNEKYYNYNFLLIEENLKEIKKNYPDLNFDKIINIFFKEINFVFCKCKY